jgi:hypothetical protein
MSVVDAKYTLPGIQYRVTGQFLTVDESHGEITIFPSLSISAVLRFSLPVSPDVNKGSKLKQLNVPYEISDGTVSNIIVGLELVQYSAAGVVETPIPGVSSGFLTTPGPHVGEFTITTPTFLPDPDSYVYRFYIDITNGSTVNNTVIQLYSTDLIYDLELIDDGDAKLVVAPDGTISISANQEPFHGWWATEAIACNNASDSGPSFWDAIDGNIQVYRGRPTNPRETHTDEEVTGEVVTDTTNWVKIDTANWAQNYLADGNVYTPASFVTISGDTAVSSGSLYPFPSPMNVHTRIVNTPPDLRWFDGREVAFPEPNNSIAMFDYFVQYVLQASHGFKQKNATGYATFNIAQNIRNIIVNTGITHITSINRVQKTAAASGFTTIFTSSYHWINPGSTVIISGFDGTNGWDALLNGLQLIPFIELTGIRISASHVNAPTYDYKFMVLVDSSAAPSETFGGAPTASTTHGPITASTEYRQLVAASYEWLNQTFTYLTQGGMQLRSPSGSKFIYDTFANMAIDVAAGTHENHTVYFYPPPVAATFYNNPTQRLLATFASNGQTIFNHYFSYPINDPFINSTNVLPTGLYDYNIDFSNYIIDPSYLWWRMSGVPTSPIHNTVANAGYKSNGSTFSFAASVVNPSSLTWTIWSGKLDGSDEADRKNAIYFGRINPAFVGGQQIGYIRFRDLVTPDPQNYAVASEFNVANYDYTNPPADPRDERKLASDAMATILTYIQSLGSPMNKIIIDIRHFDTNDFQNELIAQLYFLALAELLGENRNGIDFYIPLQNINGSQPFTNPTVYTWYQNWVTRTKTSFNTLNVTAATTTYPSAVFTGTALNPKKVLFITSQMGTKAEPLVRLCVGDALNKIIGAFTTTQIVGDNNGLTNGIQVEPNAHDISYRSPFARYPNTNPAAQLGVVSECVTPILEAPIGSEYAARLTALQPDVLLDNNFENIVYEDVGLTGPYSGGAALLGPGGAFNTKVNPVAGITTTFRDRALENAIVL